MQDQTPRVQAAESAVGHNQLLRQLSAEERSQILPDVEVVHLAKGATLYEPGDQVDYVYFPVSSVLSQLVLLESGESLEVTAIGHEGMAPVLASFGSDRAYFRLVVQVADSVVRIPILPFRRMLQTMPRLRRATERCLAATFLLTAQSTACTGRHNTLQRLARWLLITQDCVGADSFSITHETLADMLGVRRASVTEAAERLKELSLIRYTRVLVTVLDKAGLEASACECYRAIRQARDWIYEEL